MIRTTIYTGTPTLSVRDNRNQVVRTLNYNRRDIRQLAEVLIERQLTSDDGRHSQQWDARLFDLWQNDDTVSPNLHTRPSLAGQALRSDSVDAGWCVALYDAAGRIVWAEDGRGTRSRTEFDQLGRPRAAYLQVGEEVERVAERCIYGDTDGSMPDPSSYNARGQLVRHYHDAGLQAAPSYSLQGAALREQCQLLPSAEALSDWQGENESAWQDELAPQVYTTTHEYDALGGALAQTDARGNLQRWSYDVAGLLSQSFLTLSGGSEQILLKQQSWSAAGQKLQETAGNDVVTSYSYEPQTQRLVRIETRRADLSVLQDLSYGYDPVGNVIWQENAVVATRYFANQAVKARNDFQYDALYQLMSASGRENANAGIQGPALPEAMPDTSNLVNYTRSYAYDDGGNLLRIQHTGALSYSNEIVVGSRSNRALAQDSNSPITPEQIDDYFDANGNVLRMQPGTPLGWNERNQLQRVVLVDRGTEQDNDREVYQYRQGLRVRKQMRRLLDATSQRWDIDEVIYLPGLELRSRYAELAGQPQAPSEELHVATPAQGGRAQVRVLHWVAGKPTDITNDQVRYGLGDQIGSLQLELDSSGLVISQEEYYPFGGTAVLAARSATEVAYKVVRYSGKERDGTGLYYYGYRYYAPWLGRWLNPDPAGQVDGLNVYRMVGNNPITYQDVDGRWEEIPELRGGIPLVGGVEKKHVVNTGTELLQVYGSRLRGKYSLTSASVHNVYHGGEGVSHMGLVDLEQHLIHLMPARPDSQYGGKVYPAPSFLVQGRNRATNSFDPTFSPGAGALLNAHEHALLLVLDEERRPFFKEDIPNFLGFTFTPEPTADLSPEQHMADSFLGRSRSMNSDKSPRNYKSGFYAADYYMKEEGGKILYQPLKEKWYRDRNAASAAISPGTLLFGDPVQAATGTLSESIEASVKEVIVRDLSLNSRFNSSEYSQQATGIRNLATEWGVNIEQAQAAAAPPQSLVSGTQRVRLSAAAVRRLQPH